MININLIAERRNQRLREAAILRVGTVVVVLLGVVMLAVNLGFVAGMVQAAVDQHNAETAKKDMVSRHQEYDAVVAQIGPLEKVNQLLGQVTVSEVAWMYIMADISRTVPADVAVSQITHNVAKEGVSLRITGTAKDESAVAGFMLALPRDTRWADTPFPNGVSKINATSTDAAPGVAYDITVPVRDLYGGDL